MLSSNKAYGYWHAECAECTKPFNGHKREIICHACIIQDLELQLELYKDAIRAYLQSEDWNGEAFVRPDDAIDILYDKLYKEE